MEDFDWDDSNRDHIAKHDVRPEEAEQVYANDPMDWETYSLDDEDRYAYIGETDTGRIQQLVITIRGDLIRVVTCFDPPHWVKAQYFRFRQQHDE